MNTILIRNGVNHMDKNYKSIVRHTDNLYYGLIKLSQEDYDKYIKSGKGFWKPRIPSRYLQSTYVYELIGENVDHITHKESNYAKVKKIIGRYSNES